MNRSAGCAQIGIPWPLIPKTLYTAPYRRPCSIGKTSAVHARNSGIVSRKSSTTTAAPVDNPPSPELRMFPKLQMPVVVSPERMGSSLHALLSPPMPGRSPCISARTGSATLVASRPYVTALPGAQRQSSSGPCLPAASSLVARPSVSGYHGPKTVQHSSSTSPRYLTLGTPSVSPQKQWVLQQQHRVLPAAVPRQRCPCTPPQGLTWPAFV